MASRIKKRVYLDYAAATPLAPTARAAYVRALAHYGNPSAPHQEGRAARAAIEEARAAIAQTLAVRAEELVFTSGGTESNNIAILGVRQGHAVTSAIEHSSVMRAFKLRAEAGSPVTYVRPGPDGLVDPDAVAREVQPDTVLVSIHQVHSELGTVQRIADIARAVKRKNAQTVVHVDAAQSPLWVDASPHTLRADLVSYDAQKVGGPKGAGMLYRDYAVGLSAILGGGTQERGIRPGTENTAAIVSVAAAFGEAVQGRKARAQKVGTLRDYLASEIKKRLPEALILGSMKRRVANNLFISIPGVDGDYLAVLLDAAGVAATPRSACLGSGGALSESALALTNDRALAASTIRFSLGPHTTRLDLNRAIAALIKSVPVARRSTHTY